MQELSEIHAAHLGFSRSSLLENGMMWVLYRLHVVMNEYPTYGDTLVETTWPCAIEGPVFPRHFRFNRPDGTQVGKAITAWVLIDLKTRRPLRPAALPGTIPPSELPPSLPMPGMLRIAGGTPLGSRTVLYSDLDINGHMNNTRYIDWVCDTLDLSALLSGTLKEFQINYISEALPGERIDLFAQTEGNTTLTLGKRGDGRTVFEARTVLGDS